MKRVLAIADMKLKWIWMPPMVAKMNLKWILSSNCSYEAQVDVDPNDDCIDEPEVNVQVDVVSPVIAALNLRWRESSELHI
jgi:hypothetical protein